MIQEQEPLPTIGVFDSGVGGLSICDELMKAVPSFNIVYLSDNAAHPYGSKDPEELVARVGDVVATMLARYRLDVLVVACNTASTVALPRLRSGIKIPVVGVVPAVKPAAALSQTKVIGLLATPGTVARSYTDDLIRDFASDCTVIKCGSSKLVQIAERKLRGEATAMDQVREEMARLFFAEAGSTKKLDTIVLGCTHFPLLMPELQRAAPWAVQWVDSGEAIANRVAAVLNRRRTMGAVHPQHLEHRAVFTRLDNSVEALRDCLTDRGFVRIEGLFRGT